MTTDDADGRGGAERIRDAAIALFGERGFKGTSLKAIAELAEVSQALVIHHYGTKLGLRDACDHHVHALVLDQKELVGDGSGMDPFVALRQLERSRPLLRYLATTLAEGGDNVTELIDGMLAGSEEYLSEAEQAGLIKPSAVPHERAVVLMIWSLGALVMHEQVQRLLGVDFLATDTSPESLRPYLRPVIELYLQGLTEPGAWDQMAEAFEIPAAIPPEMAPGAASKRTRERAAERGSDDR